jgi:hypothetical protein
MLKLKPVGGFGVLLQDDSVLTSMEGSHLHGLLQSSISFEHDECSTIGGGSEGYPGFPPGPPKAWRMQLAGDEEAGSTRP